MLVVTNFKIVGAGLMGLCPLLDLGHLGQIVMRKKLAQNIWVKLSFA